MTPSSMNNNGHINREERRKILVVSRNDQFEEDIISYATHLAERLDYDILAINVDRKSGGESFMASSTQAAKNFQKTAALSGIGLDHQIRIGEVGQVIEIITHERRRIELVVIDSVIHAKDRIDDIAIPVFQVMEPTTSEKGETVMANQSGTAKPGHLGKTIGYGLATAGLYAAVFMNSGTVMSNFTRGGWYAAMPIATVFVFSFVHGAFASHLWSLLGIEAMKKDALNQTVTQAVQRKKQLQKKPRARAYINPFHRI
ncbi:MAG: hypothetical protein WA151_02820 [Desulfatirhabdiaceae bacterium]